MKLSFWTGVSFLNFSSFSNRDCDARCLICGPGILREDIAVVVQGHALTLAPQLSQCLNDVRGSSRRGAC